MRVLGYSWKTNEYGLTVDTVTEFHLVSPNGTQMVVTETDKDLWFALKVCLIMGDGRKGNGLTVYSLQGGFNNYVNSQSLSKGQPNTNNYHISTRES